MTVAMDLYAVTRDKVGLNDWCYGNARCCYGLGCPKWLLLWTYMSLLRPTSSQMVVAMNIHAVARDKVALNDRCYGHTCRC